jgi:hypothetical protein
MFSKIPLGIPVQFGLMPRVMAPVLKRASYDKFAKSLQEFKHTRECSLEGEDDLGFAKMYHFDWHQTAVFERTPVLSTFAGKPIQYTLGKQI